MRRKVVAMLVVVLAISVLAGACAGDPASKTGQGPLDGRSWVLYAYHKTKPIPGTEITATFADG